MVRCPGQLFQGNPVKIPVSDTQAYRQYGNAVVVPAVEEVARIMTPHLEAIEVNKASRHSAAMPSSYQMDLIPA